MAQIAAYGGAGLVPARTFPVMFKRELNSASAGFEAASELEQKGSHEKSGNRSFKIFVIPKENPLL